MRIVAGTRKGFKLKTLKGLEVRPTLEQVKECIFNMIAREIPDAVVVDMFCGSGNLGLEALSRGAEKCFFLDSSRQALKVVRENLQSLGLGEKAEILRVKLPDALGRFKEMHKASIFFVDPPYGTTLSSDVLKTIAEEKLVKKGSLFIVEHSGKTKIGFDAKSYSLLRERKFGQTEVLILRSDK